MGGGPFVEPQRANGAPEIDETVRKRIAVLGGGGASGLAVLRVFLQHPEFAKENTSWEIRAFERRHDIGGVWLPGPAEPRPQILTELPDSPTRNGVAEATTRRKARYPETPLYNSVHTNVPHPLLAFHDFLFPPETPLFPPASQVRDYLDSFADHFDLRRHIHFNTEVQDLRWDSKLSKWFVRTRPVKPSSASPPPTRQEEETFDAVVVANGHFGIPHYPNIPGINEWRSSSCRQLMHSMWYREPSIMKDLVVLVVGGGATGKDMIVEAASVGSKVIQSTSDGIFGSDGVVHQRARLVALREEDGTAVYSDGTSDSGIDFILLATGYNLGFPFLNNLKPEQPSTEPFPGHLVLSEYSLAPLARHVFPLRNYSPHTLAFMGILRATAIFPTLDCQAQAIATVILEGPETWDQSQEQDLFMKRFRILSKAFDDNPERIANSLHKVTIPGIDEPGFDTWKSYRDDLLNLGRYPQWEVSWEEEFYDKVGILREEWKQLVEEGLANEWLRDVGNNGVQDWIDFMRRVLEHNERRRTPVVNNRVDYGDILLV